MTHEPYLPLAQISSGSISNVTYLLLKGGGDQAPQFRKAAVDAVSAPFLYDLKDNDKNLHIGSSQVFQCAFTKKRLYLFLERGEGKEKEMERNIVCERNISILCIPHTLSGGGHPAQDGTCTEDPPATTQTHA